MKFITYLRESYSTSVGGTPIFKNPSKKELGEACRQWKSCRFIIDIDKKDVYVFSGELLHVDVADELNFLYSQDDHDLSPSNDEYIYGLADYSSGKLINIEPDLQLEKMHKTIPDLRWTKPWFGNFYT